MTHLEKRILQSKALFSMREPFDLHVDHHFLEFELFQDEFLTALSTLSDAGWGVKESEGSRDGILSFLMGRVVMQVNLCSKEPGSAAKRMDAFAPCSGLESILLRCGLVGFSCLTYRIFSISEN